MAGHSKFKKIKHKKAIKDEKRTRIFHKALTHVSAVVNMGGSDPKFNSRLKMAILLAKAANVPKSKIENAINKASSSAGEKVKYKEARFEGYLHSVALVVDTLTDNHNRVIHEVKSVFKRAGGSLGELGSVIHGFENLGFITYPSNIKSEDEMLEIALEAGADDCQVVEDEFEILSRYDHLHKVKDELEKKLGEPSLAKIIWRPMQTVSLDHDKTKQVLQLIDTLEDMNDVQDVWTNLEIPDDFNIDDV